MGNIGRVRQNTILRHLFIGIQAFILPHLLQVDGVQHHYIQVNILPFIRSTRGLIPPGPLRYVLPASSKSMFVFQVFRARVQSNTNLPINRQWYRNASQTTPRCLPVSNAQCSLLVSVNRFPPQTSPGSGRWNATGRRKCPPSEITPSLPCLQSKHITTRSVTYFYLAQQLTYQALPRQAGSTPNSPQDRGTRENLSARSETI